MLKNIVFDKKIRAISCIIHKSPYLCTVFFIVLDLRLTKVGARRCSFSFLYRSDRFQNYTDSYTDTPINYTVLLKGELSPIMLPTKAFQPID